MVNKVAPGLGLRPPQNGAELKDSITEQRFNYRTNSLQRNTQPVRHFFLQLFMHSQPEIERQFLTGDDMQSTPM